MGPCETYRFSEQYNLTVDDEPWQYWMKKETPGLAPLSQPAKRAVVPLLRAPTGNVTVSGSSRFAHSMAVSVDYLLRVYHVEGDLAAALLLLRCRIVRCRRIAHRRRG